MSIKRSHICIDQGKKFKTKTLRCCVDSRTPVAYSYKKGHKDREEKQVVKKTQKNMTKHDNMNHLKMLIICPFPACYCYVSH